MSLPRIPPMPLFAASLAIVGCSDADERSAQDGSCVEGFTEQGEPCSGDPGEQTGGEAGEGPNCEIREGGGQGDEGGEVGEGGAAQAGVDGGAAVGEAEGEGQGGELGPGEGGGEGEGEGEAGGEDGDGGEGEGEGEGAPQDPLAACAEHLVTGIGWFDGEVTGPLYGTFEFGQTHVVDADEERIAARLSAERETLVLFSPNRGREADDDLRLGAWKGEELLGVLPLVPPARIPPLLEQSLTEAPLEAYSDEAWSATLPWAWVREGIILRVAVEEDDEGILQQEHILGGLGAPHRFTVSRSKIVLFGDPDFDTATMPAPQLARQFFPATPGAELRVVDSTPLRASEFVVNTAAGPRVVRSEEQRELMTSDPNRWNILKHQFALRLSAANTGRGLVLTDGSAGDSSPYSFGTSVGLGWVRMADGSYDDINNAGLAAGWTGWTALWAGECGNGFIHEVGHSFTLHHFVEGTAERWDVAGEYPQDGVYTQFHPWGYDTVRRQFRTWYRVNAQGPVGDPGALQGKRDPMNGGDPANSATCFPPYTNYQARRTQRWMQDAPTLLNVDGTPGVYLWDANARTYSPVDPAEPSHELPIAVDVPVVTLIGTLGRAAEACQTYPPMYAAAGNVFTRPDPSSPQLADVFTDARWYLEVSYDRGVPERSLIARGAIEDTSLGVYSLNLDARRSPTSVALFRSPAGYPNVDFEGAELMHVRALDGPAAPLPPVVRVGHGHLGSGAVRLQARCTEGVTCDGVASLSSWRVPQPPLHFRDDAGQTPAASLCGERGDHSVLRVPAAGPGGALTDIVVHAQRVVSNGSESIAVPIHDATPWIVSPDATQTLRLWLPHEPNSHLPPGRYVGAGDFVLRGSLGDQAFSDTPVHIDLEVLPRVLADVGAEVFSDPPLSSPGSSMYFLVRDPRMGPTTRTWWGGDGPTRLRVPVFDTADGAEASLALDAWQQEQCGNRVSRWDLHAGRGAGECLHRAVLRASAEGNEHLESGHTYRTDPSLPLIIDGRRWHVPDAQQIVGTFAFDVEYRAP